MLWWHRETIGNVHVPKNIISHMLDEAGTILLLHTLRMNRDVELVIDSSNTACLYTDGLHVSQPTSCYMLYHGQWQAQENTCSTTYLQKLGPETHFVFSCFTGPDMSGKYTRL